MQQILNPVAPYNVSGGVRLLNPTDRMVKAAYGINLRDPSVIRGGAGSVAYVPPATSTVTTLTPATIAAGTAAASVTVTGTGFVASCQILYGGVALATTFTNATTCSATFPHNTATVGQKVSVQVRNPAEQPTYPVYFTYT